MAVATDIGRQPVVHAASSADPLGPAEVSFDTHPDCYRHWKLRLDGHVAWLVLDVSEHGGLVSGYELKLNSYDLRVDIELYDATQRLRFEHPEVKAVVVTSGKEKVFCAGANIRMLAASPHEWKVNFCKFTNETRGPERATLDLHRRLFVWNRSFDALVALSTELIRDRPREVGREG